ncbi:MAG: hypothetical protein QGI90_03985 [Nitrospinaceae bacterium]|jgi:hypothetical protein|nr:hypothetical protein [Nitrospinaceae bacterium]MDP7147828.1 hypothetical protein [Nitrospinaceae bacterium]|tara:strand:+ start:1633 stop:2091 length:459 start_codon:yes stop_codon:yes gene_type:complete
MIHPPKYFPGTTANWKLLLVAVFLLIDAFANSAYCIDNISFKKYSILSIPVPSKVDMTKLPKGKTFQVNHPQFILQYFFNNRDIFGMVFKRESKYGIIVHLCFFRSCEESPYDLKKVIASPQQPPFDQAFFSIKFPRQLQYDFQGLEFLSFK